MPSFPNLVITGSVISPAWGNGMRSALVETYGELTALVASVGESVDTTSTALASTPGDSKGHALYTTSDANSDQLQTFIRRTATGSSWATAEWRIQRLVDAALYSGIAFEQQDVYFLVGAGLEKARLHSTGMLCLGTGNVANDNYLQMSASAATCAVTGYHKAGAPAFQVGIANANATFGTGGLLRMLNSEPIRVFVNNTLLALEIKSNGRMLRPSATTYDSDALAGAGGLVSGEEYWTSTGEMRRKI